VEEGRFREDLFYRINVLPVTIPPLSERREDILPFAEWFLHKFTREYNRKVKGFSQEAAQLLLVYRWPGNIRELRNCVERAVIVTQEGSRVPPEALFLESENGVSQARAANGTGGRLSSIFSGIGIIPLRELENRYIHWVLERLNGNRSRTASSLGISVRGLRYKLSHEKDTD
jgi:transcriptional regulator with PAS, ATPase and Fis domain